MSWKTNKIEYPLRVVENSNVPGVFYIYDNHDDEICVVYGNQRDTATAIVATMNSAALTVMLSSAHLQAAE